MKLQSSGNRVVGCLVVEGAQELPALVSFQGCFLLGSVQCGSEMQTRLMVLYQEKNRFIGASRVFLGFLILDIVIFGFFFFNFPLR